MRFSSTRSTVPTWTPSAPITSICSLIRLMTVIADVLSVDAKVKRHQSVSVQCFATVGSPIGTPSPMESSLQAVLPRVAFAANSDARFGSLADHVELLEKSPLYP